MPGASSSYLSVLSAPGAARAFAAATLGQLSYGTVSLALLFTVQQATGSLAVTGAVVSAFGLTFVAAPVKSRWVDRRGQPVVLATLGVGYAAALLALAGIAAAGVRGGLSYAALAVLAGLLAPPLGPSMRALWVALTETPEQRRRAFSLDAVVQESLFTLGPVLVGGLIAWADPILALVVTAALILTGSIGLATSPAARQHGTGTGTEDQARGSLIGPLRRPGFLPVLIAIAGIGLALGILEMSVAARALHSGHPASAGYLLALLSLGSAIGGLLWGRTTPAGSASTQLIRLLGLIAVGVALAAGAPTLVTLGAVLVFTGSALAPAFVVAYLAADDLAADLGRTEAGTWVNTASNAGAAIGAALAGVQAEHGGTTEALVAAVAVLAGAALMLAATSRAPDLTEVHLE